MKRSRHRQTNAAFTRMGLVVIMILLFLFTGILLSSMGAAKHKANRITCVNHLKQIGLSPRIFANETNRIGLLERVEAGEVFRYFQTMSNQLATPLILTCPGDWRRVPARSFDTLSNTNLSYFVNLTALESAAPEVLFGDRHVRSSRRLTNNVLTIRANDLVYWTRANHQGSGNVVVGDGSVQQLTTPALQKALTSSATPTRLAIP